MKLRLIQTKRQMHFLVLIAASFLSPYCLLCPSTGWMFLALPSSFQGWDGARLPANRIFWKMRCLASVCALTKTSCNRMQGPFGTATLQSDEQFELRWPVQGGSDHGALVGRTTWKAYGNSIAPLCSSVGFHNSLFFALLLSVKIVKGYSLKMISTIYRFKQLSGQESASVA